MKKLFSLIMLVLTISLVSCGTKNTPKDEDKETVDIYQKLVQAETLSGMSAKMGTVIRADGSLGLPTSYEGVTFTYTSRNPEIISNDGVVTQPNQCWIESRDQQGETTFENLNDNWPVVIDVVLTYENQSRNAKLLFVVAPRTGYTCDKYLG
ncbi:MAG TPA: hypothetical protein DEA45_02370 [Acholeplasmataceae bacterium]|nr:hypothetical protein [Acholeplasmataceae bacterium]